MKKNIFVIYFLIILLAIFFSSPILAVSDTQVWQGKYLTGNSNTPYSFNLSIYDNLTGGNICYSNESILTTNSDNWWYTTQSGVAEICNDSMTDYYLDIKIDGSEQTPRRMLKGLKYADKSIYTNFMQDVAISGDVHTDGDLHFGAGTDGFYKLTADHNTGAIRFQILEEDIWAPGSIEIATQSLLIGKNVKLSAIGKHLGSYTDEDHYHLYPYSEFDHELTIRDVVVPYAYDYTERVEYQPDNSGTWTGTNQEFTLYSPAHLLINDGYFQTDTTAATEPIRYRIWKGENDSGILQFDQTYPASQFPALTEVQIMAKGFLEFEEGYTYFHRLTSDEEFSLKTEVTGNYAWIAADTSFIREDNLFQTAPWINGTNFTDGQSLIYNRTIYVANQAGVQTGTFESNLDKWDNLASGSGTNYWTKTGNDLSYSLGDVNISNGDVYIPTGSINAYGKSGENTNFIGGLGAGFSMFDGFANTFIGYESGNHLMGNYQNTFIGFKAGTNSAGLNDAVALGSFALDNADNAYRTIGIGSYAGQNATGDDSLYFGFEQGINNIEDDKLFIGNILGTLIEGDFANNWTKVYGDLMIDVGDVIITNGSIRAYGPSGKSTNHIAGERAGMLLNDSFGSVFIGYEAGREITNEDKNVFIGYKTGEGASVLSSAVGIGPYALLNAVGANWTTAIGPNAGEGSTASHSLYLGPNQGKDNIINNKLLIGNDFGTLIEGDFYNNWTKIYGDLIVENTGDDNSRLNFRNTVINWTMGFIGSGASERQFRISESSNLSSKVRLTIDDFTGDVGIGITDPQARLDVSGTRASKGIQLRSGDTNLLSTGIQILFTHDGNDWDWQGISHSIRTRHNQTTQENNAIDFWLWDYSIDDTDEIGSKRVMTIEGTGRVGIGTATPTQALDVNGNVNVSGVYYGDGSQLSGIDDNIWTNESGVATYNGDANISGNVTANYFIGDGSLLTGSNSAKAKIYMTEGTDYLTNISFVSNFVPLNGSWTSEVLEEFTMTSDGNITYIGSDTITVFIDAKITVIAPTSGQAYGVALAKNGAIQSHSIGEDHVTDTDPNSIYAKDIITLDTGDMLKLYISNIKSANDITLYHSNIMVFEI